ncbi:MAG TPA: D-glycerate dehydrogenase [Nitrospiria bacterium]|nr:D-glycerate dehydrogenase [Nitrospiria bacterium]
MAKAKILLTRTLPEAIQKKIARRFNLVLNKQDRPLTRNEIIRKIKNCDGVISMLSDPIDSKVMDNSPRLKIIANYAVGYNNIDLAAARLRGITVTHTPGILTETTADLTFALLLAVARNIVQADNYVRKRKWTGWAPTLYLGTDLFGKTIGIIGMGRIGKSVARRASGFSMRVLYHSRKRLNTMEENELRATYADLETLFKESDFISLHLPFTSESRHLIGKRAFSKMKESVLLINTARGPIVDEAALVQALKTKRIAGAGLDVYEEEPRLHPELYKLSNVVLLPHIGSASEETRIRMGEMVLQDLLSVLSGNRPIHPVLAPH